MKALLSMNEMSKSHDLIMESSHHVGMLMFRLNLGESVGSWVLIVLVLTGVDCSDSADNL